MQNSSILELENNLQDLKNKRCKLSKELSNLDTEIIDIKITLDRIKERERILIDQERSKERSSY